MRDLNVKISDEAYDAAKEGAARAGMLLRIWVERLILSTKTRANTPEKPERTYEPMEEF